MLILNDFVSASYFNPIIEFLIKNFGYVRGQNLIGAPYDFRKAPSELSIDCCSGNSALPQVIELIQFSMVID